MEVPIIIPDFKLFNEDCLQTCRNLKASSVDLIYVDPPFFTGRDFNFNGAGFCDKWNSIDEYINWMKPRLRAFKRILSKEGSIYIHCDWHSSHYLKVLADHIFGMDNFLNEIAWKRQSSHNDVKQGSRHLGRIHDSILLYTKSQDYVWNQQFTPYEADYVEQTYRYFEEKTERRYALGDLSGPGGASNGNPSFEFLGTTRYWRFSKIKMLKLYQEGMIVHKEGRVPLMKRYLDEMQGKPLQDIWNDIAFEQNSRIKFPTRKPESLLKRIIEISSNPFQTVYDPFSGSGTSAVVCSKLGRKWMGSEISWNNCQTLVQRLITMSRQANESKLPIENRTIGED
jgi:adenine-specific DNA-methyltransferase